MTHSSPSESAAPQSAPQQSAAAQPEVITEVRGRTGFILLNRPKALNALSQQMIADIHAALKDWAEDDAVEQVLIHGAGERGLCAGGDIVAVYRDFHSENPGSTSREFFASEYAMDSFIHSYPKPYIALMDGIVLGGGMGVSVHGSHRVVTERTKMGMPETGIGFLTDIGATWFLPRIPGELGTFMAMTGQMITGADACALGLADVYVDSASLPQIIEAVESEPVVAVLERFAQAAPESELMQQREWIDDVFAGDDPRVFLERLRAGAAEHPEWGKLADTIESKSPTSTFVTLALIRAGAGKSLEEAFDQELETGMNLFMTGEMAEGVRAQVVDKDRTPKWNPPTLAEVDPQKIQDIVSA